MRLHQPGRLLVFTDVTAREKRRRDRDAQLRGLTDSVPGAVFRLQVHTDATDRRYRLSFLSEAATDLLGLSPHDTNRWLQFVARISASHRDAVLQSIQDAATDGCAWQMEVPLATSEEETRWLLGTAAPEQREDAVFFNGVFLDITKRKAAAQALRRSEERFRALTEQVVDVVAIFAPTGHFQYLSPSVEHVTGFRPDALLGADAFERVHPEDVTDLRAAFEKALRATEGTVEAACRFQHRDGTYRHLSIHARRITGLDDTPKVIASVRDVTEARERRTELIRAKEEAEEASRLKSALLANMSHEVRTPLTLIIGFAEMLSDSDLEGRSRRFVETIYQSSQRLMDTLSAVLNLSRLEAGAATFAPEPLRSSALLRDVATTFAPAAQRADVDLQVEMPSTERAVETDAGALRHILTNLVGNAIKFTDPGGTVTIQADVDDDALTVAVRDTGIGMDPAFIPTAFRAFQQESTGDDRAYEGSGLGLAIVDRYADLIGAQVRIESEKGTGTTVTVRVPLEYEGSAPSPGA